MVVFVISLLWVEYADRRQPLSQTELEKLKAAASMGYARGQLLPSDRKDW
jgi:hypothetical protein